MMINKRERKKNKGHNSPHLTWLGNWPIVLFLLIFLTSCPHFVYAENSEQTVNIQHWDKPKEYVADIEEVHGMFWCGQDTIALSKGEVNEKTVLFFYKTDLSDIKKEIMASHTNGMHNCSDDGQYLYFKKADKGSIFRNIAYYDRKSGEILNTFQDAKIPIITNLTSPQRNYIIAPPQFNKSSMPEIDNARIIPRSAVLDENPSPTKIKTNIIEWDPLERRIYSLDIKTQILSIIDVKTLQKEKVKIKGMGKYEIRKIKAVNNPDKLFLVAVSYDLPDKDMQTNVYLLNLADKSKPITLFLSDIRSFDISPTGIAVYSRNYGATIIVGEGTIYDRDSAKRCVSINLVDEERKEKNIKKLYFDPWSPNSNGFGQRVLEQNPIIMKDGLTVAYIEKVSDVKYRLHLLKAK